MQEYYAIYSRKSKFTGKGESTHNQIELCKNQIINKYGSDVVDKVLIYQDEGFTGYNTNRPEFKKMMADIRNKKIKLVVVYRLDRISRNVSDFCDLKDKFSQLDKDIHFLDLEEKFGTGVRAVKISSTIDFDVYFISNSSNVYRNEVEKCWV